MTVLTARSVQSSPALRLLLRTRLNEAVGRVVTEARVTPYRRGGARFWCVMVLGCDRREIPLPKGAARRISNALRTAFPDARWRRAQDYDVTTGVLTEHVTHMPACLLDGAL